MSKLLNYFFIKSTFLLGVILLASMPMVQSQQLPELVSRHGYAETIFINGMEAATGWIEQRSSERREKIRFVAIRFSPQTIYRFVFVTPSRPQIALANALKSTTYSFRKLSRTEAARLSEQNIRVVQVGASDTVETLANRMAYTDFQRERFEVLNGLPDGKSPLVGESVKLITR